MKGKFYVIGVLFLVIVVVLTACASAQVVTPSEEEPAEHSLTQIATEEPTKQGASSTQESTVESPPATKVVKVAALIPGRIDDMSFNQQFYEGLMRMKEHLGSSVEVTYTEGVYQVVDIEPALRDYASKGYDLIIGHGYQFQDPIMAVAPDFPDVNFALGPGNYLTASNVSLYDNDNAQMGYLFGTVAGLVTQTKKITSIGGMDVPNVHLMHEGYRLSAEAIDPTIEVFNLYTGDFRDSEASREAALSMIDRGADVVYVSGDGITVGGLEAAKQKNVLFMTGSDMSALGPEVFLASVQSYYEAALEAMVEDIIDTGKFQSESYPLNLQNGGLELTIHLPDKTKDVQDKIDGTIKGLIDGTVVIPEIKVE